MDVLSSVEMLKWSSRRKPTRVMSNSLATCTARPDGAPTAATIGAPPVRAFCSSSMLARTAAAKNDVTAAAS
jgi:hypothetical protein